MSELLTLKDIIEIVDGDQDSYWSEQLKKQSIKYVKEYRKIVIESEKSLSKDEMEKELSRTIQHKFDSKAVWIKMFFNLTEEDLK